MVPKETEPGIESVVKTGKTSAEVYDLLFGLTLLEPRYTLLFRDARIDGKTRAARSRKVTGVSA